MEGFGLTEVDLVRLEAARRLITFHRLFVWQDSIKFNHGKDRFPPDGGKRIKVKAAASAAFGGSG